VTVRVWSRALGAFGTNCYILACGETQQAAVIDPGTDDPWIQRTLTSEGLQPVWIILTHGHLDHIGGVAAVKGSTGAPVAIHQADAPMLRDPALNGGAYFRMPVVAPPADRLLADGDVIELGHLRLQVLHTPGHTPGGICLYLPPRDGEPGYLFAGDTLFAGAVGRTDLPGGDHATLIASIRQKLLVLPDETMVYPGHAVPTTIGDERAYNPFL
jgi:hydroxyacylglutathione hydrolase